MSEETVAGSQSAAVSVQDSTKFKLELISLQGLFDLGTPGGDTVNSKIDAAAGFLQRLAQQLEWRMKENARAKKYIHSLVKGSGYLDAFVVVPADLIKQSAEIELSRAPNEERDSWKAVLKYVENRIKDGTEFFIIDGQNRLNESLIPFIKNQIPFDSNVLLINDSKGKEHNVAGKYLKDLPSEIQAYIRNIKVPYVTATKGDIFAFSNAIIWKNEGIAWNPWQKMIMRMWYTNTRKICSSIASEDGGYDPARKALKMVTSDKYAYDKNGHDRLVAEFLIWMDKQFIPNSISDFKSYFTGGSEVKQSHAKLLKKYLKDFGISYSKSNKKKVSNTEMRNYVMLRFILDNSRIMRKELKLSIPNWEIRKSIDFTKHYSILTKLLMSDPEQYGELPKLRVVTNPDNTVSKTKNPGSYAYFNSENEKDFVLGRLRILLKIMSGGGNKKSEQLFETLKDEGIIVEVDTAKMPSIESIGGHAPIDADGDAIPISKLSSEYIDRGHKIAKSKGGSNTDVVLQKKRPNRQWQEDYEHTQQ